MKTEPNADTRAEKKTASVSFVIPAYNELENLLPLIEELRAVCASMGCEREIIIIDDGSTDGTSDVLRSISDVTLVSFRRNFGQTAAFDAGFKQASNDYVVTMDGDGQNDPADVPRLIAHLEENGLDAVSGWRVNRKDTVAKHIVSRVANLLRKVFLRDSIHDSGCSLKVYRRECFNNINLFGEMHRFIPALLQMQGFSVGEIHVNHRARTRGKTKYNFTRTVKGLADLMLLWFWSSYSVRPIHLLGGLGVLMFAISAVLGLRTIYLFMASYQLSSTLEPLLTVFTFTTGLLFMMLGIVTDILVKIYYAITREPYYSIRVVVRHDGADDKPGDHIDGR